MIEKYLNPRNTGFVISVLKSGAFDGAKSVVLESVYKKYLFNCGEGTYRCLQDCNLNHLKIEDILITHKSWENVGGLYGMLVSRFGTLLNQSKGWSKKRSPLLDANGMVNIHGPPEVEKVLLETVNPDLDHSGFIDVLAYTRKHEISGGSYSNFQIEIEYVKIPKSASLLSDTKEKDSDFSVAYVIRPKPKWTIDNSRLNALGIGEKRSWKSEILKKESRRRDKPDTVNDGRVITNSSEAVPPVVVLECPSEDYLESMISSDKLNELSEEEDCKPQLMVHMSPADIVDREEYKMFLDRFRKTDHLLLNKRSKHSVVSKSVSFHQCLNNLHPGIFPDLQSYKTHAEPTKSSTEQIIQGETNLKYYLKPHNRFRPGFHWDRCFVVDREKAIKECYKYGSEDVVAEWKQYLKTLPVKNGKKYPEVVFLGTGSTVPLAKRTVSAILLHISAEKCMMLDCGEGTLDQLRTFYGEEETDHLLTKLEAIFISHNHTDHHLGLCGVIKARQNAFLRRGLPVTQLLILGTPQVEQWLYQQLRVVMPGFWFGERSKDIRIITHTHSKTFRRDNILKKLSLKSLRTPKTYHIKDSRALCLIHRSGWKLVYSGDTRPCKELVTAGNGCDLLIHEATFSDALKEQALLTKHSTISEAIKIGREMGAKFTVLTHFSQRYHTVPIFPENMPRNVAVAFDLMKVNLADLPIRDKFIPVLETVFEGVINQTKEDEKKIVKKTEKKIISESHDFTTLKNIIGNEIDVEPDISSDKTESVANAGSIDIGLKSGMHDNSALEIIEESKLYVETANDRETHGYSTPESILDINEMCNETGTSSDKSESVANAGLNDIRKISETHDNGAVESVIDINEIYNETGISSDDCSALDSIIDINEIYNETGISSDDYCALDSIIDINEIYNETGTSSDTSEPVANAGSNDIRKISETLDDGALANIIENKLYVEPSSDRRTYDYSALESIIDCEMYNDETETSGELNSPHPTVFKQADIAETSGELNSAHSTVLKQTDIAEHLELNDTRMKIPCGGKKSKVDS